ncbi:DsrE family protein [Aurantiacibacter sediminis]|uniref:DsrE family protein n=1 Tax=Aurantiacibacter sediminis TaxID=2793064 RepID=A0ABS0MZU8_9SPHN|nr:DsrE family protein [Aurantiacibacter sediminis]MBH5321012.1 DsrE family protein [Aurantiacibacter sediminis]
MMRLLAACVASMLVSYSPAFAQSMPEGFANGPVFEDFGPHASVEDVEALPAHTELRHSFDVASQSLDRRNRGFESAARFVNMHAANGVNAERITAVVVVHGSAVLDLLTDEALATREGEPEVNPSGDMVRAMIGGGVRFIVCGQSATAQGVSRDELIPGVEMALSAMTAHALLQQQGYTVNPF